MTEWLRSGRIGALLLGFSLCGGSALAQTSGGTSLPSGFTAPGLPFGPTSTVPTVAGPTPVMAIANPGGLSFGGGSSAAGTGLGSPVGSSPASASGLSFSGGGISTARGGGAGSAAGGIAGAGRQSVEDVTGSIASGGGGGAPAGAGIAGGAGLRRTPTDSYFDPLSGSGFR